MEELSIEDERREDPLRNVPRMSFIELFYLFLKFGFQAWGGPVAQISMLKDELVIEKKWIDIEYFKRIYAVYQVLPGPEALELCMFFGCLSKGRIGGMVAGLGFLLPGTLIIIVLSYIYHLIDINNIYITASFKCIKTVVAAMVLRAVHKLADHSFIANGEFSYALLCIAVLSAIQTILRLNIFITLGFLGIVYTLYFKKWRIASLILLLSGYAGFIVYIMYRGLPSEASIGIGIAKQPDAPHMLALGLMGGMLSFGGAYTTIPFIRTESVLIGGWLSQTTFIDAIAIGQIIPAPLVAFVAFVGFQGGLVYNGVPYAFLNSVLISLGMYFPCFLFTIIGHNILEQVVNIKALTSLFEGITAALIGMISITALDLLKKSVDSDPMLATVYLISLTALYQFKSKYISMFLVVMSAIAGQLLMI